MLILGHLCRLIRNADGLTTIKLIRYNEPTSQAEHQHRISPKQESQDSNGAGSPKPMDAVDQQQQQQQQQPQPVPMDSECSGGGEEASFRHMHQ